MASVSASSTVVASRGTLRHRTGAGAAWVAPGGVPPICISTSHETGIKDPWLRGVARTLMDMDRAILDIATGVFQLIAKGKENRGDEVPESIRKDLRVIQEIYGQFKSIELSEACFHEGYFQERIIVTYWAKSLLLAREFLKEDVTEKTENRLALTAIERAEDAAAKLPTKLLGAASEGSLTRDMIVTIEERWTRLDEILNFREREVGLKRQLESWDDFSQGLELNLRSQPTAPKSTSKSTHDFKFWFSTTILWSTVMTTTITAGPLFALGYRYSNHHHGTTEDADFYFLLQANLTQALGIVLSYIPVWKSQQLPNRVGIPLTALAFLLTVLAIPVYVKFPTEWSSFLTMIGQAIQAFMILQIVISGA